MQDSKATAPPSTLHIRSSSKSEEGVDVVVLYNCGCGFKTSTLRDAVVHSASEGHKMEIRGRVEVSK